MVFMSLQFLLINQVISKSDLKDIGSNWQIFIIQIDNGSQHGVLPFDDLPSYDLAQVFINVETIIINSFQFW